MNVSGAGRGSGKGASAMGQSLEMPLAGGLGLSGSQELSEPAILCDEAPLRDRGTLSPKKAASCSQVQGSKTNRRPQIALRHAPGILTRGG